MMRRGVLIIVVAVSTSTPAHAVPRFDVYGFCNRSVGSFGNVDALRDACLNDERTSYTQLRRGWGRVPRSVRNTCVRSAALLGGSYVALAGCVEETVRRENRGARLIN